MSAKEHLEDNLVESTGIPSGTQRASYESIGMHRCSKWNHRNTEIGPSEHLDACKGVLEEDLEQPEAYPQDPWADPEEPSDLEETIDDSIGMPSGKPRGAHSNTLRTP